MFRNEYAGYDIIGTASKLTHVNFFVQDVSLLLDVCRQSIVFREGRDLVACFVSIAHDPSVTIVRVKNRLDPGYNSAGGYRDVCINLRIGTEMTVEMNVDYHVCEVQLILLPFAAIKVSPLTCFDLPHIFITITHNCIQPQHQHQLLIPSNHIYVDPWYSPDRRGAQEICRVPQSAWRIRCFCLLWVKNIAKNQTRIWISVLNMPSFASLNCESAIPDLIHFSLTGLFIQVGQNSITIQMTGSKVEARATWLDAVSLLIFCSPAAS